MFEHHINYALLPQILQTLIFFPSTTFVQTNFTLLRLHNGQVPLQPTCFFITLPRFCFAIPIPSSIDKHVLRSFIDKSQDNMSDKNLLLYISLFS